MGLVYKGGHPFHRGLLKPTIELAIDHCLSRGIHLVRGPIFDLTSRGIVACGWDGAVLIHHRKEECYPHPGWLKVLCEILGENTYWTWRFNYGFNQGRAIQVYREVKGQQIWFDDEVSSEGSRLARQHNLYR